MEANLPARFLRWRHEVPDRCDNLADGFVVRIQSLLEPGEFRRYGSMSGEHFTQPHKCAHHKDTHLYRTRGIENAGRHNGSVLGEGPGQIATAAAT